MNRLSRSIVSASIAAFHYHFYIYLCLREFESFYLIANCTSNILKFFSSSGNSQKSQPARSGLYRGRRNDLNFVFFFLVKNSATTPATCGHVTPLSYACRLRIDYRNFRTQTRCFANALVRGKTEKTIKNGIKIFWSAIAMDRENCSPHADVLRGPCTKRTRVCLSYYTRRSTIV